MTRALRIEEYVRVLLPVVRRAHVCRAVDAMLARDTWSRWFEEEN